MTTLWEKWTKKDQPPALYNPLKAKLGASVSFDLINANGIYTMHALRQRERRVNGKVFLDVDYDLGLVGTDYPVLRLRSTENKILFLLPYDPPFGGDWAPYNADFHNIILGGNKLEVTDNDGNVEAYWKVGTTEDGPIRDPIAVHITIQDKDGLSELDTDSWDFARLTNDELGGQNASHEDVNQYLFVDMNKDSGEFQMWRGHEIDLDRVTIL